MYIILGKVRITLTLFALQECKSVKFIWILPCKNICIMKLHSTLPKLWDERCLFMWQYVFLTLRRQSSRSVLASAGFLLAACTLILLSATTQATVLQANRIISQNWRSTYDLVVLPPKHGYPRARLFLLICSWAMKEGSAYNSTNRSRRYQG